MTHTPPAATLLAAILLAVLRDELEALWDDLHGARVEACRGEWSMRCDDLADRIKTLTRLAGPTPWDRIPLPLLRDGVYQRLHADIGVHAPVDQGALAEYIRADAA